VISVRVPQSVAENRLLAQGWAQTKVTAEWNKWVATFEPLIVK